MEIQSKVLLKWSNLQFLKTTAIPDDSVKPGDTQIKGVAASFAGGGGTNRE